MPFYTDVIVIEEGIISTVRGEGHSNIIILDAAKLGSILYEYQWQGTDLNIRLIQCFLHIFLLSFPKVLILMHPPLAVL